MNSIKLSKLNQELALVKDLFDTVRVVEPIQKTVVGDLKPIGEAEPPSTRCFYFWERKEACINCISTRALNNDDVFIKIEYHGERLIMITAVPVVYQGEKVVLEMLKDITDKNIIDIQGMDATELQEMINRRNYSVVTDELTSTFNKNYLMERMPYEITKNAEEQGKLSIIFADIDNLKSINFAYGDSAGDYIIKEFASILSSQCREGLDWVARYGGDEFIVVLSNTSRELAEQACEKINRMVSETTLSWEGQEVKITASFGVYTVDTGDVFAEELLDYARQNLYLAKKRTEARRLDAIFEGFVDRYQLTARESEVAGLLLEGITNNDIAGRLFISIPTVKKHISEIFNKAMVKSRSEFLAKYQDEVRNTIL
ncbi:MAG: diguanylate cyclase [Firmicutes bacterium]|nr:diguanylate cyclase [Bacillota bacterium]